MLFSDEVRPTKGIPAGPSKKPPKAEVDGALAIIDALATDWDPARYTDCYRERLRKVIDNKRKRQTIEAPTPDREPSPVPDLMAALKATLDNIDQGDDPRAAPDDASDGNGLAGLSKGELQERASKAKIKGRTKMSKRELIKALE